MSFLSGVFSNFFYKIRESGMNDFIFYKIVDSYFADNTEYFKIQCINTAAVFSSTTFDIVFDSDLLLGLHPSQSCYIGIEYAKLLSSENHFESQRLNPETKLERFLAPRYGKFAIYCQDRSGDINFFQKNDNQFFYMDPRDIALSRDLICNFDAGQAFYIGLQAGLKLTKKVIIPEKSTEKTYLRLVK
jgi:hypothetical protein